MSCQEYFLIVLAWIVPGLDVDESELSSVGSTAEIGHRHDVRMDEARSRCLWRESVSDMAVGRDFKALFFNRAINGRRNDLTMPVDKFRGVRVVKQIDGRGDPLAKADERSRYRSVLSRGANRVFLGDICQHWADVQSDVGRASGYSPLSAQTACRSARRATASA